MYSGGFIPLITRPTRVIHQQPLSITFIVTRFSTEITLLMESWWQIYLTTIQFFILLIMIRHRMSSILKPDGITQLKIKTVISHNCQTLIGKMFYSRIPHRGRSLCSIINLENYMIIAFLCNIYLKSIILGSPGCLIHYVMLSKRKINFIGKVRK